MREIYFICIMLIYIFNKAQHADRVIFDSKAKTEVLYGYCSILGLKQFIPDDFKKAKEIYRYDMEKLFRLRDILNSIRIVIVLGTWCPDSREHVPIFITMLENINLPLGNLTLICVDRSFDAAEAGYRPYGVQRVPTFIFLDSHLNEIGRIIEHPSETLEKDMAKILGSK